MTGLDDWAARLGEALAGTGSAATVAGGEGATPGAERMPSPGNVPDAAPLVPAGVAAIGARAGRLIDAVAAGGTGPPATALAGPRFATLADCLDAARVEREAAAALLTLDALGDDARRAPRSLDRALGTLCRLYPARLLLLVRTAEGVAPETLFAFGFRRLLAAPDAVLHEYRLRDYKLPPDWLNARFWANPERFALDGDELDGAEEDEEDEDGDEDDGDGEE